VLQKAKLAYTLWLVVAEQIPRIHRYGLRSRVEFYFLELLESIFTALFLPPIEKIPYIERAMKKLNGVKFFLQLCWENKLVPNSQYIQLTEQLNEIGRMLGGWKIGIEKKTLARTCERKPQVSGRKTR